MVPVSLPAVYLFAAAQKVAPLEEGTPTSGFLSCPQDVAGARSDFEFNLSVKKSRLSAGSSLW